MMVESMCEAKEKMLCARGTLEHIQRTHVDNIKS